MSMIVATSLIPYKAQTGRRANWNWGVSLQSFTVSSAVKFAFFNHSSPHIERGELIEKEVLILRVDRVKRQCIHDFF